MGTGQTNLREHTNTHSQGEKKQWEFLSSQHFQGFDTNLGIWPCLVWESFPTQSTPPPPARLPTPPTSASNSTKSDNGGKEGVVDPPQVLNSQCSHCGGEKAERNSNVDNHVLFTNTEPTAAHPLLRVGTSHFTFLFHAAVEHQGQKTTFTQGWSV